MKPMQTRPIPNKDLKPCSACGGHLGPIFFVYEERVAAVNRERANMLAGTATILGGNLAVAEALSTDSVVDVTEESLVRRYVCNECRALKLLPTFRHDEDSES